MAANEVLRSTTSALIASGANTSSEVNVAEARTGLLTFPSALTGNTLTFRTAPISSGTFSTLKNSTGGTVTVTMAANTSVPIPAEVLSGAKCIKLVSSGNEGADRTITIELKS